MRWFLALSVLVIGCVEQSSAYSTVFTFNVHLQQRDPGYDALDASGWVRDGAFPFTLHAQPPITSGNLSTTIGGSEGTLTFTEHVEYDWRLNDHLSAP